MLISRANRQFTAALPRRLMVLSTGAMGQTMLTAVIVQVGLFITGPLVARMLGAEDRGYLAALTLWPTIIATIAIWGLPTAVTLEIAQHGSLTAAVLRGVIIVAAVQSLVTIAANAVVVTAWMPGAWEWKWVAMAISLMLGPAFIARDYTLALVQGTRNFRRFNMARLSHLVVYAPIIIVLFALHAGNLGTIMSASVLATFTIAAVATHTSAKQESTQTPPADQSLRSLMAYGQKAHFGRLMPIERFRADQMAVALMLSPAALGLFAVATAFTNILRFLTQAIGYVAFPAVASEQSPDRARHAMWRYVRIATAVSLALVITLELIGPWLINVLYGEEFSGAGTVLRMLLPGVAFTSVRRVMAESMRGAGSAAITSVAETGTVLSFLVLIYPLTSAWELSGVAITIAIAEGIGLASLLVAVRRRNTPLSASQSERRICG